MTPRPADGDEDWEDDLVDFHEAKTATAAHDDFDFGGFAQAPETQMHVNETSNIQSANEDEPLGHLNGTGEGQSPVQRNSSVEGTPKNGNAVEKENPVVETAGDFSEFSQSYPALAVDLAVQAPPVPGKNDSPHHGPPVVETVGDLTEFSQSEAASETFVVKETKLPNAAASSPGQSGDLDLSAVDAASANVSVDDNGSADQPLAKAEEIEVKTEEDPLQQTVSQDAYNGLTSTNVTIPTVETVDNSEGFGDFDEAEMKNENTTDFGPIAEPQEPSPSPTPAESQNSLKSDALDAGAVDMTVEGGSGDNSRDLLVTMTETNPHEVPPQEGIAVDNVFGAFDTASSATNPVAPASMEEENYDGFRDYGAAAPALESKQEISPIGVGDSEGDDFGDFGAANPEKDDAPEADNDTFEATTTEPPAALSGDDEDEFSGFGIAPAVPAATESTKKEEKDDDAFGAFDAAPLEKPPMEAPEEENMGNLDAAPAEPVANLPAEADGSSDDEFSNFDTPPVEPTTIAPEMDGEDDFGDFDTAPPSTEPPATSSADEKDGEEEDVAPPPHQVEDDSDDFGEFDAAPAQPQVEDDGDDFGDFDAAPPGELKSDTDSNFVDGSGPQVSHSDPILQPVVAAMHRMFPFQEKDDDDDDDKVGDPEVSEMSVGQLMVSYTIWETKKVHLSSSHEDFCRRTSLHCKKKRPNLTMQMNFLRSGIC